MRLFIKYQDLISRLHQHNFSYKKPKGVPHKFDEEKLVADCAL
jgi:hypothetical protein